MRLHRRGVDQHLRRWAAGRGQSIEDVDPDALGRPSDEAVVEGLVRSIDVRRVPPSQAISDNVDNSTDDTAVIDTRPANGIVESRVGCAQVELW